MFIHDKKALVVICIIHKAEIRSFRFYHQAVQLLHVVKPQSVLTTEKKELNLCAADKQTCCMVTFQTSWLLCVPDGYFFPAF